MTVNCAWSQWSKWSNCSQECGGGSRISNRTIRIESKHDGEECDGDDSREESCNLHPCPGISLQI